MPNENIVYPHAPITEALLDIRIEPLKEAGNLEALNGLAGLVSDSYPNVTPRLAVSGGFSVQNQPGKPPVIDMAPSESKIDGYIFKSNDGRRIFQARLDGFTFNLLKPYSEWAAFSAEAKRLWILYQSKIADARITRLAVRYINRVELPLPIGDFKDYILTIPEIARPLPQGMAHFFMTLVIPHETNGTYVIINETMEPPQGTKLPFIFDIDAVREEVIDFKDPKIWEIFDGLRGFKNRVFKESLTDKAKELFR
jgi:uncharacterized protein (TIGR04255 family)